MSTHKTTDTTKDDIYCLHKQRYIKAHEDCYKADCLNTHQCPIYKHFRTDDSKLGSDPSVALIFINKDSLDKIIDEREGNE